MAGGSPSNTRPTVVAPPIGDVLSVGKGIARQRRDLEGRRRQEPIPIFIDAPQPPSLQEATVTQVVEPPSQVLNPGAPSFAWQKPCSHRTPPGAACRVGHACPQTPQLSGSASVLDSQPSLARWLQSYQVAIGFPCAFVVSTHEKIAHLPEGSQSAWAFGRRHGVQLVEAQPYSMLVIETQPKSAAPAVSGQSLRPEPHC